ncbi:MAG: hypothetical protein HRT88_07105, partial [Lentisphaeraceae bacterium]|nr:hypothetical protein [Lentisphaeraceae bacterium]
YERQFYDNFSLEQLQKLKVTKDDNKNRGISLNVDLQEQSPDLKADWSLYTSKNGKVENITYSTNAYNGKLSWSLRKYKDHAPFTGSVNFKTKTGVETFNVKKPVTGKSVTLKTKPGRALKVSFDKNHVSISSPRMAIDNFSAYNAKGAILKHETQKNSFKNGISTTTYVYWGKVNNVKFQTFSKEVKHQLLFDLPSNISKDIIKKTRADIKRHQEIIATLKKVSSARKKHAFFYGGDLAHLYYSKQSIAKGIADSDPLSADIYSYKAQAYMGYTFTLAEGKINYSNVKEKFTNKYTRKKKVVINGKEVQIDAHSGSYNLPYIVAYPEDKSQATYFLNHHEIFWKVISERITYFPQRTDGWNRMSLK